MPAIPLATLPGVLLEGTHAERPDALDTPVGALFACSTHGLVYQTDGATWYTYLSGAGNVAGFDYLLDAGNLSITTGVKSAIEIPFACTITAVRLFASSSGSIVVDLNKSSGYAGLPTLTSICASAKPTLSSAQKYEDTTLTGWTTAVAQGDWIAPEVESVSGLTLCTISLSLLRS